MTVSDEDGPPVWIDIRNTNDEITVHSPNFSVHYSLDSTSPLDRFSQHIRCKGVNGALRIIILERTCIAGTCANKPPFSYVGLGATGSVKRTWEAD
jgi:hypothetical protein